ncbi:MAG: DUF1573 domain-containing protein [Bacteroidetes bacterium]|nr:MAG: DUF1573 domain-containing protein [Bacteroidota bacterium]
MRVISYCLLALVFLFSGCFSSDKKSTGIAGNATSKMDSSQFTTIEWIDSANRDFGKIAEGKKLDVTFRFKNTGSKPLIIERVQPSCGCTVAEQPTEPILPGQEGLIKASFNSEGHVGVNNKRLYVYANTKTTQNHELNFVVRVEKKKW